MLASEHNSNHDSMQIVPTKIVPAQIVPSKTADEDACLIEAVKSGDAGAFEALVKRYDRKLLRIAQQITHSIEDAQEVVQETFFKAYRKLGEFRGDAKFSTWLFRIAVNQSLMRVRKQRSKQASAECSINVEEEGRLPIDFSDWRPNPEEEYQTSELRELLTGALQALRPTLRIAFILHDIEGHSLQEAAATMGISLAAAKTRSLRARLQLRERLSAHFKKVMGRESSSTTRFTNAVGAVRQCTHSPAFAHGVDECQHSVISRPLLNQLLTQASHTL
jgi:RNA polymerase sigma-70 factor (ECF subfamily)